MKAPETYVDWHCRACGHEHETDQQSWSTPCKCPECGEERVQRGSPSLPINLAWCDSEPQQYDLCGGPKTIQVYLCTLTGDRCGTSMDPDYVPDCDDDPIAVAEAVLEVLDSKYLWNSKRENIEAIIATMKACEEESDRNVAVNRIHKLRKTLVLGLREYADLHESVLV